MSISGLAPEPEPTEDSAPKAPESVTPETKESANVSENVSSPESTVISPVETPQENDTPKDITVPVNPPSVPTIKSEYDLITDALLGRIGAPGTSSNFKIMIYSEPGGFKTSWLRTAPGNLVCDLEDGAIAMASAAIATGVPTAPGVKCIPVKSFHGAEALLERIENNIPGFDKESYPVFSIDTASELHKKGIEDVKNEQARLRPSINRFKIETDDHAENNQRIQSFVRRLRDLDRDIILTSHARTVEPKNKPAKTYPDYSESMANKIMAMMDVVAYITVVEDEDGKFHQIFRVMPGAGIFAKSRIPLPAAEIMDPTWPQLKQIFMDTLKKAEEMAATQ